MFNIGWSELFVVASVAILVVGPKELPGMLRTFGRTITNMRRMAGEFQAQFKEALQESDLADAQKSIGNFSKFDPKTIVKDAVSDIVAPMNEAMDSANTAENKSNDSAKSVSVDDAVSVASQTSGSTKSIESKSS
ncbi:MAG: twin-arginine translocase subunit TatB [Hyphomicrobiales bacterium]|nr:MAG: twin-arginine translocase subunit TatB [Hyphomicrobiales bacterium]